MRSCARTPIRFETCPGACKMLWEPSKELSADVRVYASARRTQALYFNITESVNDTSLPVRVNNAGVNERKMFGTSLKLDYVRPLGTLTSITAYDRFNELLTGDQFNFLPIQESVLFKFFGADQAQHQFLDVNAVSEALQIASTIGDNACAGSWVRTTIATDRFISTGNVFDLGTGVVPEVRRKPLPLFNPQFTYLADSQDNFAWAVFGNVDVDLTDKLELSTVVALRPRPSQEHHRDAGAVHTCAARGHCIPGAGSHADLGRPAAESHVAPQADTRFHAVIGYSRGFRSGGFNQTGVGAAGIAGVDDLFDAETADTYEVGAKAEFLDRRVGASAQRLPHEGERLLLLRVRSEHEHAESGESRSRRLQRRGARSAGRILEGFDGYVGLGFTDSDIKESSARRE